jgi:hypothetical protein
MIPLMFVLHIHATSFEAGWQGEMAQYREAFHSLGVLYAAEFYFD